MNIVSDQDASVSVTLEANIQKNVKIPCKILSQFPIYIFTSRYDISIQFEGSDASFGTFPYLKSSLNVTFIGEYTSLPMHVLDIG